MFREVKVSAIYARYPKGERFHEKEIQNVA
jgi:hypothetical protein